MKKIFSLLFLITASILLSVYCLAADAPTKRYTLYLASADSGLTTVASGTSAMVFEGPGMRRSQGLQSLNVQGLEGYMSIQLNGPTGITVSQVQRISAGNNDLTTHNIYIKFSDIDSAAAWSAASRYQIAGFGRAMSGTTLQEIDLITVIDELPWSRYVRIEAVSGTTPLGKLEYLFNIR